MAKILIVEDNQGTNKAICEYMKEAGHTLFSAFTGSEALKIFRGEELDIIVLDIMLPEMSGIVVLHEIRKVSNIPVIMLTALDDEYTQSNSFDEMADDYITKPFSVRELMARVKANLRKNEISNVKKEPIQEISETEADNIIKVNDLELDLDRFEVKVRGEIIDLTLREFEVLKFLASQPGQVITRETLLEKVWGYEYYGDIRTVDVTVRRIREKIEKDTSSPKILITKRGVGYYIATKK